MVRIHRAWWVALVTFAVLLAAAAFRSSMGTILVPLEHELMWTRSQTSIAVSINLVVYGVTAPFAASLMERFGVRQVAAVALGLVALGTGLSALVAQPWHLVLLWGVLVGLGTGATALVFGALVINRWFVKRRGLVLGLIGAAWATGQLVFLPIIAMVSESAGWRVAVIALSICALALIPVILLVLANRPSDVGLEPYGADEKTVASESIHTAPVVEKTRISALGGLAIAARSRVFWLLAGTFAVCGWTTNGIVSTHFVADAHDHGMGMTLAAGLMAIVGLFDVVGTVGSGWLTDKVDARLLLAAYYLLRGSALAIVPLVLGPHVNPPLFVVLMLFGLDWVATVPPTITLCRRAFGIELGAIAFGWVFASHMIGAAVAAYVSGYIHDVSGGYAAAWYLASGLAIAAAAAALLIPKYARD